MNSAIERLLTLRVADVMSKPVVTVSSYETMGHAARVLMKQSISGVPVVDEQQSCAGVLSALDFVKKQGNTWPSTRVRNDWFSAECEDELICNHMTSDVYSIASNKPLLEAAKIGRAHV